MMKKILLNPISALIITLTVVISIATRETDPWLGVQFAFMTTIAVLSIIGLFLLYRSVKDSQHPLKKYYIKQYNELFNKPILFSRFTLLEIFLFVLFVLIPVLLIAIFSD